MFMENKNVWSTLPLIINRRDGSSALRVKSCTHSVSKFEV